MNSNWYEHFFHGVALEMWRRAMTPETTRTEAEFLAKEISAPPDGRLLDIACGNGRHTRELSAKGYALTGVDISAESIDEARAADPKPEWVCGDMRNLPWQSAFNGGYCMGNSFGYLQHEGTLEFLQALSKTLKPGARFVFEIGTVAESLLANFQPRAWYDLGGLLFLAAREYKAELGRLDIQYTFISDGVSETREASFAVYTAAEIARMMAAVGMPVKAMYGTLEREPFKLGSPRLLAVAEKLPA